MNRQQRRVLREALGQPTVNIPFTIAFWVMYGAVLYRLIKGF